MPPRLASAGATQDDDAPMRLLANGLRSDVRIAPQREVDPAPLEGGHRLELKHLAAFLDLLRGARRDLAQLALTPAAVVLDVDQDARPGAELARQHEVDQVLQCRQALA